MHSVGRLLISLALVVLAVAGCKSSPVPEVPEFPDLSELPLSEFSDQARAENTLPWADIEATCHGIIDTWPISQFSMADRTTQPKPGQFAKLSKYSGDVWGSSRSLAESSTDPETIRGFYLLITYLDDEGFAAIQLEELKQFNYEITSSGTAFIALSSPEINSDGKAMSERSGTQIYIFDGLVVSSIGEVSSTGGQHYCSRSEMIELAEQLVAGIR
jgi:hypothetical protein